MPAERTTMRQVREVLWLQFVGGVPTREIARRIGLAPSTVRTTIKRFEAASLSWPLPDGPTDAALEARLFADAGTKRGHRRLVEPDWTSIHRELKRKHVTLSILWDEYVERNRRATATPASASFIEAGKASSRSSCSSITPATPSQPWIAGVAAGVAQQVGMGLQLQVTKYRGEAVATPIPWSIDMEL
jgi:Sigma-70, region 4